jgi:hypothetical protein
VNWYVMLTDARYRSLFGLLFLWYQRPAWRIGGGETSGDVAVR